MATPSLASAEKARADRDKLAARAARLAARGDVGREVVRHQATAAQKASLGVAAMLAEQGTPIAPDGILDPMRFTATAAAVDNLARSIDEPWRLERFVRYLVIGAWLSAEEVAVAARPGVGYVRHVGPACCRRCAVLAGRWYRWSAGFRRHPGCLCGHVPSVDPRGSRFRPDVAALVAEGRVTGLSAADQLALDHGATLSDLTDLSGLNAGNPSPGRSGVTPVEIFAAADGDRDEAVRLLKLHGYLR